MGLSLVNALQLTASKFMNDAEDKLMQDNDVWLEKLAQREAGNVWG